MREFRFDPSRGPKPNDEILMPPNITPYPLPFNWAWQQNPHITQEIDPVTGKPVLVNTSKLERLQVVYLPHYMENIPQGPIQKPPDDRDLFQIIKNIKELYYERPIWTRRAIINKVNYKVTEATLHLIRLALPYIGYRFRDGPFKDAIIQFGLDPRKDPKYRMYQTIYFQLAEREVKDPSAPWTGIRKSTKTPKQVKRSKDKLSHFFDGRDVAVDGKIWQMCDVTDPLLARLIKEAPISETFDAKNDGWFCNGTLAKIRAIMKVKMIALHTGRIVKDEDFKKALEIPDIIPDREGKQVWIPVPDVRLSKEEMEKLRASGKDFTIMSGMLKQKRAYNGPLRLRRHPEDEAIPSKSRSLDDAQERLEGPRKENRGATPEAEAWDRNRRPISAESVDSRYLANQFSKARLGDNIERDVDLGDNRGYDEDEDETEDSDSDRSWDLGRGASEADSVDMVEFNNSVENHDSSSQLAPSIEGQE
jgi:general transcription factor 3C polypeptide 5 (transcription factor C subunit 1)